MAMPLGYEDLIKEPTNLLFLILLAGTSQYSYLQIKTTFTLHHSWQLWDKILKARAWDTRSYPLPSVPPPSFPQGGSISSQAGRIYISISQLSQI